MNKLTFFKLELKRNLKLIPYLLAAAVALSLLMGVIAFCAAKIMYYRSAPEKEVIAVSSEDDSKLVKFAIASLSKSDSLSYLYTVKNTSTKKAMDLVNHNEALLGIVVPSNFMDSLSRGQNPPIRLYYSSVSSIKSMLITELSLAAQNSLKAAEAGIYTNYDFYAEHEEYEAERVSNEKLDTDYLAEALFHKNFFIKEKITATGSLSLVIYYIAAGIMVVMLLLGCLFILRMKNDSDMIALKLRQNGINVFFQSFVHIACIFLTLLMVLWIGLAVIFAANLYFHLHLGLRFAPVFVNSVLLCLCCSTIISFSSSFIKSKLSALLFLFMLTISFSFVSGAFMPTILLPSTLHAISPLLPTTWMLKSAGYMLKSEMIKSTLLKLVSFSLGFGLLDAVFTCFSIGGYYMPKRIKREKGIYS